MWYAASEIVFFLVLAAVIGGLIGYGIAQIYQIDFGALRASQTDGGGHSLELASAYEEIADLRRKLQITTEALRGEDTPIPHLEPPIIDPRGAHYGSDDVAFPPGPDAENEAASGRRLSDRVADAERA